MNLPPASPTAPSGAGRDAPIRVLVVDDNESDFYLVSALLHRNTFERYDLKWAANYHVGLEELEKGTYDVAIVDYSLGLGTGLELLRAAKNRLGELPVILLTGHDSPEIDRQSTLAGAADYLCKTGLSTGQLERSIRYALRHGRTLAELRQSRSRLEAFLHHVPCAVAICDPDGRVLFRNGLFADNIRDFDRDLGYTASATPWIMRDQERCWLVSTFPIAEDDGRPLLGLAAVDITARVRAEEERLKQTEWLDNIMKNLPVIVGRLDREGRVVEGRGSLIHCGISAPNLIGREFAELFPLSGEAIARALQHEEVSFSLRGKLGDREWHADFYAVGNPSTGVTFLGRDVTERRWLEQRLLTAIDAEQQRIGADLHDGLGQKLTGLACVAAALRERLQTLDGQAAEQANLIASLSNDATIESRALARGLCPVQLEEAGGLTAALTELIESASVIHDVRGRFRAPEVPLEIDHLTGVQLYRIAQEALNNAVRHGAARSVEIALTPGAEDWCLTIADDGKGFRADSRHRLRRGGLRLMEYRAITIGGALTIDSEPGLGTRVRCTFPLVNPALVAAAADSQG